MLRWIKILFLTALLTSAVFPIYACAEDLPEITVWLDPDNQYMLRRSIGVYEYYRRQNDGTELEAFYPEVSWNLIDKSYLTPEEYRRELYMALEAGEGPTLLYMNEWNMVSPTALMEQGFLIPFTDPLNDRNIRKLEYITGTLDVGTRDGELYVLPITFAWDGESCAKIHDCFGINRTAGDPNTELALRNLFQNVYIAQDADYSAISHEDFWTSQEEYLQIQSSVTEAVYIQDTTDIIQNDPTVSVPDKQPVITVFYGADGQEEEHPVTKWLSDAASQWNHSCTVCLIPGWMTSNTSTADLGYMSLAGTEPDLIIGSSYGLIFAEITNPAHVYADLSALLKSEDKSSSELPDWVFDGVSKEDYIAGIPFALSYLPGIWYNTDRAEQAGLSDSWQPQSTAELTLGLRKLKDVLPESSTTCVIEGSQWRNAFISVLSADELIVQEEDQWKVRKEPWTDYLALLRSWKDNGLVTPMLEYEKEGYYTQAQAARALVSGELCAVIGNFDLLSAFDVLPENVSFVPLGTTAESKVFAVSGASAHKEEAFDFLFSAFNSSEYEPAMRELHLLPVTPDTDTVTSLISSVSSLIPSQRITCDLTRLERDLWFSDRLSAETLAEKYPLYDFTGE